MFLNIGFNSWYERVWCINEIIGVGLRRFELDYDINSNLLVDRFSVNYLIIGGFFIGRWMNVWIKIIVFGYKIIVGLK